MRPKTLFWRLYLGYALIVLLSLLVVGGYAGQELGVYTRTRLGADLEARAHLVWLALKPILDQDKREELESKAQLLGRTANMRVTLIAADGRVVADSHENPSRMDNHADRPEVKQTLLGAVPSAIERYSNTLKMNMLYVAMPARDSKGVLYVTRVAVPLTDVAACLHAINFILAMAGLAAIGFALVLGYLIVGKITRPIVEMERSARRLAEGDFQVKFWSETPDEIGRLAETMNVMVAQLDEKVRSLVNERNEREAILSSMTEGVIAVDADERLLMANQAAREMLGLSPDMVGRPIVEAVRNTRLQALLRDVLTADTTLEGEAELLAPQKRVLKLTGAPLRDESGREIGCVAVLNDVTHLRALERMRSEFVANVSHELKTPITAVKGYIETLREGAIAEPANAAKFLDIIAQHADRLNAIVDDLLSLSRIESDAHSITLEPLDLRRVVAHSLGNYRGKAAAKKIGIQGPEAGDPLPILGNANLLEQAVGNILDNAIKFSPEGTNVRVSLAKGAGAVTLEVADQGIGISERDLPRIFERFYRADKGRSRELSAGGGPASGGGGTGLGLAIVKHIILAHKGEVSARSTLGKGSVFTIRLPLAASV